MRVGLTWLSRTSRRGNMPARQGFRPASGVSEAPKTSVQVGTRNRSGSPEGRSLETSGPKLPGQVTLNLSVHRKFQAGQNTSIDRKPASIHSLRVVQGGLLSLPASLKMPLPGAYQCNWLSTTIEEFIAALDSYIRWYNEAWIKISLGSRGPIEYRRNLGLAA